MTPIIIGIGGGHSGVGKTTLACRILGRLRGWGAIKYTKTSLYASIIDDRDILSEEGKDTKRLLDAGAEKVLWIQSPFSQLEEILPIALEMLSHLEGIVVEGNSALGILNPDIIIFISGPDGKIKPGADRILNRADVVIFEQNMPQGIPEGAKEFQMNEIEAILQWLTQKMQLTTESAEECN